MSEVDEIKKLVNDHREQRDEAQKRINLAIETVDRDRKAKRDELSRPN